MATDEVPLRVGYDVPKPTTRRADREATPESDKAAFDRRTAHLGSRMAEVRHQLGMEWSARNSTTCIAPMLHLMGRLAELCEGDCELFLAVLSSLSAPPPV